MSGWKYARKDISSLTESTVTVINSKGNFSMGYFFTGERAPSVQSASFGYLSHFGDYALPDTTYKCDNGTIDIDGGYASSYEWTLPDGSKVMTPKITASTTGLYKLKIDQDPHKINTQTRVLDRFDEAAIILSGRGETVTYSVRLYLDRDVTYDWYIDTQPESTDPTFTTEREGDELNLILTDTIMGCSKTLTLSLADLLQANEDRYTMFACDSAKLDVLANDVIPGGAKLVVTTQASRLSTGTADTVAGKIVFTPPANCNTVTSYRDSIEYSITKSNVEKKVKVYLSVLKNPSLVLKESCTSTPTLVVDIQYPNTTYIWEYSTDNGTTWQPLPNSGSNRDVELRFTPIAGAQYRVRFTVPGVPEHKTSTKKLQILQQTRIAVLGEVYYEMRLE